MMKIIVLASKIIASINCTISTVLRDNNLVLKWINYEVKTWAVYLNERHGILLTKTKKSVALSADYNKSFIHIYTYKSNILHKSAGAAIGKLAIIVTAASTAGFCFLTQS